MLYFYSRCSIFQKKFKIKIFYTDSIKDEDFNKEEKIKQWEQSLNNKEFIIELLALIIFDDIFILNDSFRLNADN